MVIHGPWHPARNFMAGPSRIPEVALNVEVVILGLSSHLYAREVPQRKNMSVKARNAKAAALCAREHKKLGPFTQQREDLRV
jgi:hypothetical protein